MTLILLRKPEQQMTCRCTYDYFSYPNNYIRQTVEARNS